ncbi:hypothetical protein N0V88_002102 [Collariella sp. IMI 366227]|nr:hypothetical protein N0V88_002102 [Collariella sp. IMI 366227]
MAIDDPELIIGIAALIAAAAALLFAIIQTGVALAQHIQVSGRCSPRVTGVFNLTAGFWFQVSSLSWNPQYRMPVLTMPGLRGDDAAMAIEANGLMEFIRPGKNFLKRENGYVDNGRMRVTKSSFKAPKGPVSVVPTAILSFFAAIWTPIGLALSSVLMLLCFMPAFGCMCICGGACGGSEEGASLSKAVMEVVGGLTKPLTFAWKMAIRRKEVTTATKKLGNFAGFRICGVVIRWEWRLATMIPLDVYGATIETTMADLRLFAAMGGMHPTTDPNVIARTRCGEMLMSSHHLVLGRIVYYRSGRENIRPRIDGKIPMRSSRWLQCIMLMQEHLKKRSSGVITAHPTRQDFDGARDAIATILSRPRTEFDAQIECSLGKFGWIFQTEAFQTLADGIHASDSHWAVGEMRTFLGPLGQGIGSCSCVACSREWLSKKGPSMPYSSVAGSIATLRSDFWPALMINAEAVADVTTPAAAAPNTNANTPKPDPQTTTAIRSVTKIVGPILSCFNTDNNGYITYRGELSQPVQIETLRACRDGCADLKQCTCGTIARVQNGHRTAPTINEMLIAAAINTKWLGKCSPAVLAEAADPLASWVSDSDQLNAELRKGVSECLTKAWAKAEFKPAVGVAPQGAASATRPALRANFGLVRVVMAATEVYLTGVRKAIGTSSMWDGPVTEAFDDFGPVVLGA